MSALRNEIRAILREEIAALGHGAPQPSLEQVRITSSADLSRFARDLMTRAINPDFAEQVASGAISFALTGTTSAPAYPIVSGPERPAVPHLDRKLLTEKDIAGLDRSTRNLRVPKHCRITPLANDEARRRGIRIERTEA